MPKQDGNFVHPGTTRPEGAKDLKPHACKPGPGKFEGESALAIMAYESANLGCADMSTKGCEWFRSPLQFDADEETQRACRDHGICAECIEKANDDARELAGCMIREDSQGFVYLTTFDSREAFDAAMAEAMEEEATDDDDE